jgi:hypothetical protein
MAENLAQASTATERTPRAEVTYYTVSDHRFFLGSIALLNSLALTGNGGELVVLDAGLTPEQRELLSTRATVVDLPEQIARHPHLMRPYAYLVGASGTVVVIDSDIIVTASLDPILDRAREGKIAMCPAWTEDARRRWFAEWEPTLQLRAPLRRDDWVHNGFVAFSTQHWPHLLARWWEVCELIPSADMHGSLSPFQAPDADALNALLMSEVPRDGLTLLAQGDEVFGGDVTVEDFKTLRCTSGGRSTKLLHLVDNPKPWERSGWLRLAATDYVRLMRRLLFASDVPLRLDRDQAPLWLRPGLEGELTLRALGGANRAMVWSLSKIPEPLQERVRGVRRRVAKEVSPA